MNSACIIHYLEITILSFLYRSHIYLFHHQTLHMCNIHPYDHVEFFSEFFETLNVIFKVFKIRSSNTPGFQKSTLSQVKSSFFQERKCPSRYATGIQVAGRVGAREAGRDPSRSRINECGRR